MEPNPFTRLGAARVAMPGYRPSAGTTPMGGFGPPKAGFARSLNCVMLFLWSARPRRKAYLVSKREKSVKWIRMIATRFSRILSRTVRLGLMIVAVLLGVTTAANSESLPKALSHAYVDNPLLAAEQARQRVTDELEPQAKAGWRPTSRLRLLLVTDGLMKHRVARKKTLRAFSKSGCRNHYFAASVRSTKQNMPVPILTSDANSCWPLNNRYC